MRLVVVVTIILTAMVTQSCKITMPPLIEVLSDYNPRGDARSSFMYNFSESKAVRRQAGFRDTLIIGDNPESSHGKFIKRTIIFTGIPEEHTVFFSRFGSVGGWRRPYNIGLSEFVLQKNEQLRRAARVVHAPKLLPFKSFEDLLIMQANDMFFVLPAGNMMYGGIPVYDGDRDLYNINHVNWSPEDPERDRLRKESYRALLEIYATGKAILTTSAKVTESGEVALHDGVVRCGDVKESSFTVIPEQTTSAASARLAAMSFYLAQFFETPEEIADVLKSCAVDIGEPGVDREYGQGIANLLCPRVLKKEIEVVSAHLGETEEQVFSSTGGVLEGVWQADNTVLQVYVPSALKETVQTSYDGAVNGSISFAGDTVTADFTAAAAVDIVFLVSVAAKAEDVVQFEGSHATVEDTLHLPENTLYTYTATADSLHLIKSLTLNEALALLPDPLGSMVDMASPDFFENTPIQIRMSFARAKPLLVGDFDEDGMVAVSDFLLFVNVFGLTRGDGEFDEIFDLVPDGNINIADFLLFIDNFGKTLDS